MPTQDQHEPSFPEGIFTTLSRPLASRDLGVRPNLRGSNARWPPRSATATERRGKSTMCLRPRTLTCCRGRGRSLPRQHRPTRLAAQVRKMRPLRGPPGGPGGRPRHGAPRHASAPICPVGLDRIVGPAVTVDLRQTADGSGAILPGAPLVRRGTGLPTRCPQPRVPSPQGNASWHLLQSARLYATSNAPASAEEICCGEHREAHPRIKDRRGRQAASTGPGQT